MPKVEQVVKGIDSETNGVDFRHGARPWFVNLCDGKHDPVFWEWDVDPIDRTIVPETDRYDLFEDLKELQRHILDCDVLVGQNMRFDFTGLTELYRDYGLKLEWPWDKAHDLLFSAHLLDSKKPKDLTAQALIYCDKDLQPFEDAIKRACHEARRFCRSRYKTWRLAKEDLPEMPSAKGGGEDKAKHQGSEQTSPWKLDMWLPRQLAIAEGLEEGHEWYTVAREYANPDAVVLPFIWKRHQQLIKERGLEKIYEARRGIPKLVYTVEERGVTVHLGRLSAMEKSLRAETEAAGKVCLALAGDGPCAKCKGGAKAPKRTKCKVCNGTNVAPLLPVMPTGTTNGLRHAVFENLKLPKVAGKRKKGKKDSGIPSMDAVVMGHWLLTLDPKSDGHKFISALSVHRKRTTTLSYAKAYRRFGLPVRGRYLPNKVTAADFIVMHPSLNPTGTDTLRWSSARPNEQNISKQDEGNIRYAFGPLPGREWWSKDAKNIELRLPAYESGEPELIALFERPDDPPFYGSNHTLIFSTLHERIWADALKKHGPEGAAAAVKKTDLYRKVKNGNFAVQYGAIDRSDGMGTADIAYGVPGAQKIIASRFAKQDALNQKWIAFAEDNGYVETIPDRTVDPTRGYPLVCTLTEYGGILPTVPLNYHVQGSAMWWMCKAMLRCQAYLDTLNADIPEKDLHRYGYFIAMQVHDELVFDMPYKPDRGNQPIADELARLMTLGGDDYGIPTPVGIEYNPRNWSEVG